MGDGLRQNKGIMFYTKKCCGFQQSKLEQLLKKVSSRRRETYIVYILRLIMKIKSNSIVGEILVNCQR